MAMTKSLERLRASFRNSLRREDGSVAIETAIMMPLLVWAFLAMFTIFDNFRQYNTQQKAAYTISDLISRQVTPLDNQFINGVNDLFQSLSRTHGRTGIRITVASYDLASDEYEVVWSRTRGGIPAIQSVDIADWHDRLPVMPQDEQVIIFETTTQFRPVFNVGLDDQTINTFVFTRPRYAKQICYNNTCS